MTEMATIAPVTKSIRVGCSVERAFHAFTAELAAWWPLDTHAIHAGAVREVVWEEHEGGEVFEISESGERAHWATVLVWEPPVRLVLAWHVNPDAPAPTEIEVRFTPEGAATRLDLEHRYWERLGETAHEARASYDGGWDHVLTRYAAYEPRED